MQHLPSLTHNILDVLALQLCTYLSKWVIMNLLHAGIQSYFCSLFPVYQYTVLHVAIHGFRADWKGRKKPFDSVDETGCCCFKD